MSESEMTLRQTVRGTFTLDLAVHDQKAVYRAAKAKADEWQDEEAIEAWLRPDGKIHLAACLVVLLDNTPPLEHGFEIENSDFTAAPDAVHDAAAGIEDEETGDA